MSKKFKNLPVVETRGRPRDEVFDAFARQIISAVTRIVDAENFENKSLVVRGDLSPSAESLEEKSFRHRSFRASFPCRDMLTIVKECGMSVKISYLKGKTVAQVRKAKP